MNGSPSVRVALFIRESGSESPCRWFYVTGIYKWHWKIVLIETYWNVNMSNALIKISLFGINRNILECITQQNGLEINFWKEHIHIMQNVIPSSLFGREYGTDCI